jgi:hypothetical protein
VGVFLYFYWIFVCDCALKYLVLNKNLPRYFLIIWSKHVDIQEIYPQVDKHNHALNMISQINQEYSTLESICTSKLIYLVMFISYIVRNKIIFNQHYLLNNLIIIYLQTFLPKIYHDMQQRFFLSCPTMFDMEM